MCLTSAARAYSASLASVSIDPRPERLLGTVRSYSAGPASIPIDPKDVYTDNEEENLFIRQQASEKKFKLSPRFIERYATMTPPFGFNGLGEFVYQTRYARVLPDGSKEQWYQTVERVVNGTYNMQRQWIEQHDLGWNPWRAQRSAQEMFDRIFRFKFLPPGRGLWAMGSPLTEERYLFAALNNCAFVSTEGLKEDPTRPFTFLMDAAMLGVGVGFDTAGADSVVVKGATHMPAKTATTAATGTTGSAGATGTTGSAGATAAAGAAGTASPSASPAPHHAAHAPHVHVIADSREGWVESLRLLLEAHFHGGPRPAFDYTAIRPRGSPIRGFGGTASGPEVLQRLHEDVDAALGPLAGKRITITAIVDIMNHIGRCIVSGDVRQTAEIAFGDPTSDEYIDLKNYDKNPHRAAYGWTSNNSVLAPLGMSYDAIADRVRTNGEPGFAWIENMRAYGRMGDAPDWRDKRARGGNPCLEQTLESYELCCLVETFPANHDDVDDFKRTLKFAYLYAKTVTLGRTHWPVTNRVMLRNRRIGCSVSGVAQFIAARGLHALKDWCEQGYAAIQEYDKRYSDWLAIPRSIKTTCVKPSGTVSLLAGATPGVHHPESRFYIRRVRIGMDHEVVPRLVAAGYAVEPAAEDPARKLVVSFPVDAGEAVRPLDQLSMWEQLSLAAFLQRHWADNQVSCTITFDPAKEGPQVARALDIFQYQLKGVSLLPRAPTAAYKQLPYEAITGEQYAAEMAKLKGPLDFRGLVAGGGASGGDGDKRTTTVPDLFCDAGRCELEQPMGAAAGGAPPSADVAAARVSRRNLPSGYNPAAAGATKLE